MSKNAFCLVSIAATTLLLASGASFAADNAGPEPYKAPDPHYSKAMQEEPLIKKTTKTEAATLGTDDDIKGPAAGPEPYSGPTPND